MSRVLLVEDDPDIGAALVAALAGARHEVEWCRGGGPAITAADAATWELVVLDLGLPDLDGLDVCRALRARLPQAIIVVVTARDAEVDVVVGLESGADDYLVKPVRVGEFLARVRAHLRRVAADPATGPAVRHVGSLRVDDAARRAWLGDHEMTLRAKQFDLLARLARGVPAAVSREELMSDVWDANWFGSTKTLDVHIAGLRRELGRPDRTVSDVPSIATLRGFGYRLEPAGSGD